MQTLQTTKRDKRDDIKDANEKIFDIVNELLLTSILIKLYRSFAMRIYVVIVTFCQMLINIIKIAHYLEKTNART